MHRFINFKGFANAELDLMRPITVLIGPNGSGKSNVIEAVELLSVLAHGRPLHEVVDVGRMESGFAVRGGLQSCPRAGTSTFTLEFQATITFENNRTPFVYSISVAPLPFPRISNESLLLNNGQLMVFRTVASREGTTSSDTRIEFNNFARGSNKPQASITASRSALSQYKEFALNRTSKYESCKKLVDSVVSYLRASFVFDPMPWLMRQYERMGFTMLAKNGFNLSAVLYGLQSGDKEHRDTLAEILGWIRQVPEEPYDSFEFITTPLQDVMLALRGPGVPSLTDARLLSDGTLRCLAVLTALATAERSSRVVIEEFDNGVHPGRVAVLLQALEVCCSKRKLNVLLTTHNPSTLNHLTPTQLAGVVICARDGDSGSTRLVPLDELPRVGELLERGRLGDLVSRRVLEAYLSPKMEEERRSEFGKWLEDLP